MTPAVPSATSVPLKYTCSCNDESLPELTDPSRGLTYIEISDVTLAEGIKNSTNMTFEEAPSRARRTVRAGDVLVSTVRTYLRAIAPVPAGYHAATASTGFAVLRPRTIRADYLGYAVHGEQFLDEVIARSVGVSYPAINASDMMRIKVNVPTLEEQRQIAEYLDRETGQIDALIAKQKQLVEKLAERRRAVIAQAVTRGLNPHAELKNSRVAWIGRVPAHWHLGRVKHLGDITLGKMIQPEQKEPDQLLAPYMRAANVQPNGQLASADEKQMWFGLKELRSLTLHAGDVVVVEGGMGGYGRAAYLKEDLQGWGFQNSINRVRMHSGDGRYLTYVLLVARAAGFITAVCAAVSMPHFTAEKLARFDVPLPPDTEQKEIADYIDDATAKIDALTAKAREMTAVLRERRQALISAAVTGKIDVRGP